MVIQNFDQCYQVMRHLGGTQTTEEFLCQEMQGEGRFCLLLRIADQVLAKRFTLFLEEKIKDREFTDYRECFQSGGSLYAVFGYSQELSLIGRLETERCSLKERTEIARGLLEQLLLLNPHPFFAWNGLRTEQITVSRSLDVRWNYHIEEIENFDSFTMKEVCEQLLDIWTLLFGEERKKQLYPLLETFFKSLERREVQSYLELYQGFAPVWEELLEEKKEKQPPRTFWFRLWERIKRLLAFLRKVLALMILAGAVLYVIYIIRDESGSQVVKQTMQQIGDLEVKQDSGSTGE